MVFDRDPRTPRYSPLWKWGGFWQTTDINFRQGLRSIELYCSYCIHMFYGMKFCSVGRSYFHYKIIAIMRTTKIYFVYSIRGINYYFFVKRSKLNNSLETLCIFYILIILSFSPADDRFCSQNWICVAGFFITADIKARCPKGKYVHISLN